MNNKITKKDLRKFGIVFGLLLCSSVAYHYFKEDVIRYWTLGIGTFAVFSGVFIPILVKPLYSILRLVFRAFMWILTRVVLVLVYIITIIPIGLIMRIIGKDPMNRKIEKERKSYWIKKDGLYSSEGYLTRQY